jgi:hypothetical protein
MIKLTGKDRAWYCAALAALLVAALFYGCTEEKDAANDRIDGANNMGNEDTVQWEEKIYWDGTIEDNFDGNTVLVVMDKNIGGVNKVHDKSFFGDIEIESIEDLTSFPGNSNSKEIDWNIWRQILAIKLPGDSKENVVKAIRHLEKIDGIKSVSPNHRELPN